MAVSSSAPTDFVLFGPAHLAILFSVVLVAALLAYLQRRYLGQRASLRIGFAIALLADTAVWYGWMFAHGLLTFPNNLPLELCDVTLFLTVAALFTLNEAVFDLAYYLALAGASMALLTPNLLGPFPSFSTVQFFVAHGLTVAGVLYLLWAGLARPRRGSILKAMLGVNAWACIAGAFDWFFNTNYMYLRHRPVNASLLSVMGPWPWYILAGEGVALVFFVLLYLPHWLAARVAPRAEAIEHAVEEAVEKAIETAEEAGRKLEAGMAEESEG